MSTSQTELLTRRRFTVTEYERMAAAGVLTEDDRVELIDGEIVMMAPIGSRHAGTVMLLTSLWTSRLGERVIVSVQNPVELDGHSEPQPDIALLRPRADFYRNAHPRPDDVLLLIEVADPSVEADRRVKIPLYARAGIRESGLVDLVADRLDTYRRPAAGSYQDVRLFGRGQTVSAQAFPDLVLTSTPCSGERGSTPPTAAKPTLRDRQAAVEVERLSGHEV